MTELLAPAGDIECFDAALKAGADAIYVGGSKFGARAYAQNFRQDDLISCLRKAHIFGKKVYLTINTLMKESELFELPAFLKPYYEEGIDGVIVQDFGAMIRIGEMFPGLELHASTQMTVTGSMGAEFLKQYGVSRIVPARELSLREIAEIKSKTGLETETFIHGAMCYGYSGQCLFSSMLGQRSGNRGRCAGPCRLPYGIEHNGQRLNKPNEMYQLSLKDLCVLNILPELMEAGIDSFKIEGRMKSPEYVAFVTGMYRKYMDLYEEQPNAYRVSEEDVNLLQNRFSRGSIQSGYYFKHNGRELVTLDKPGYQSFEKEEIDYGTDIKENDNKIDLVGHFTAIQNQPIGLAVHKKGFPETTVVVYGDIAGKAQKCAATWKDVEKQLIKTGNTIYSFDEITFEMDNDLFLPNKELNELRRKAITAIEQRLLMSFRRNTMNEETEQSAVSSAADCINADSEDMECSPILHQIKKYIQIEVRTLRQLCAVPALPELKRIYISSDCITERKVNASDEKQYLDELISECRRLKNAEIEIYMKFPSVCRQKTIKIIDSYRNIIEMLRPDGFCVGNLESFAYVKEKYKGCQLITDSGMHMFNCQTASFYMENGVCEHILSYELHKKEIDSLVKDVRMKRHQFILPVYGYIPLMESAGCLLKTNHKCTGGSNGEELIELIDRQNKKRIVVTHCNRCENTIYNSVPLSLHKELQQISDMNLSGIILRFTTESGERLQEIVNYYKILFDFICRDGSKEQIKEMLAVSQIHEFTKGHFAKGVE